MGRLRIGTPDARLSSVGGLVSFNAFTREQGLHRELRRRFGRLKTGRGVVYPMAAQMQLLLDAWMAGAQRVMDIEILAADPLFVHLAGGSVPSIDVLYDDLRRFDPQALEDLEELVAEQGVAVLRDRRWEEIFIDIDPTVMPLFGEQEGARPGLIPDITRDQATTRSSRALLRPGQFSVHGCVLAIRRWASAMSRMSNNGSIVHGPRSDRARSSQCVWTQAATAVRCFTPSIGKGLGFW